MFLKNTKSIMHSDTVIPTDLRWTLATTLHQLPVLLLRAIIMLVTPPVTLTRLADTWFRPDRIDSGDMTGVSTRWRCWPIHR